MTKVKLYYSTDAGSTWSPIVYIFGSNTGRYSWTVPAHPSTTCRVKIFLKQAVGTNVGNDMSNGDFTIQ